MEAYSLGAYSLGPRIRDVARHALAWEFTAGGLTISSHESGIWQRIHLHEGLQLGGIQSRATESGSGNAFT